jgi:signal transduction histidine kinase
MRRSLIIMAAATTAVVLIALLVPMSVLLGKYALEDRLARAALEVQATETVVSGHDKGSVSVYLSEINQDVGRVATTVLYPDGTSVGPDPGENDRVRQARATGQARVDDIPGGAEILVPVSLGGGSALPENTPVIRVRVFESGLAEDLRQSWLLLGVLGVILLAGTVVLADRLGRSFVEPVRALAATARRLSTGDRDAAVVIAGPPEVQDVATALQQLVSRVEQLLARERTAIADLSHRLRTPMTRLRLGLDRIPAEDRDRFSGDLDELARMVDDVVREARRSEQAGLTARCNAYDVVRARTDFWRPLAEDQGRRFEIDLPVPTTRPEINVAVSASDLEAVLDALLDNVFTYTAEGTALAVRLQVADAKTVLTVDDAGDGFSFDPESARRGTSYTGSTGLGLDIARRTAEAAGGDVRIESAALGGARVSVRLPVVAWR